MQEIVAKREQAVAIRWVGRLATPGQRFWSRMFDLALYQVLIGAAVAGLSPRNAGVPPWDPGLLKAVMALMTFLAAMMLDTVVQGYLGQTLGRWIAGIRVEMLDHSRPSMGICFQRNMAIYVRGLFLGAPVLTYIAIARAFQDYRFSGMTAWDRRFHTRVFDEASTPWRVALVAVLFIAIQASVITLNMMAR